MVCEMQIVGRSRQIWRAVLAIAGAWLLVGAIAGCATGGPEQPLDPMALESGDGVGAGLMPRLGFGATAFWSSAVRPVKEPVSTLHRAVMMTAEMLGRLITAPLAAIFPERDEPVPLPLSDSGMDMIAWEKTLDELTGTRQTSGTAQFLIDGEMFFPVLYDAIEDAEKSIDVRLYIWRLTWPTG